MAQYRQDETDISLSMLLEVVDALKGYGADVVIVGGWAPYLLLQKFGSKSDEQHVGSLDGDLALNFKRIPEEKYETIVETLTRIGYVQRTNAAGKSIPASFQKTIKIGDVPFAMQIDFLAGEYGGTAKSHRHQKVQEMLAHKGAGPISYSTISTRMRSRANCPTGQNCVSASTWPTKSQSSP
jgi:hypothetical protein